MMRSRAALFVLVLAALSACAEVDDPEYDYEPVHAPGSRPGYQILTAPGDTLDGLARHFAMPREALIEANHLRPPYAIHAYQSLLIPPPATYRVRPDDTVVGISTMLGVDEAELARANGLRRPYHMVVGQVLAVPGGYGDAIGPAPPSAAPYPDDQGFSGSAPPPHASISAQPLPPPPGSASFGAGPPAHEPPPPQTAPGPSAFVTPDREETPSGLASQPHNLSPPEAYESRPEPEPRRQVASAAPTALVPPSYPPPASEPPRAGNTPTTASAPDSAAPHFLKPVAGPVIEGFGASDGGQKNDGVNIAAASGAPVRAAEAGTVIYTGNELAAFGNLVLIRHAGGWVTAYGHLNAIGVKRNDVVMRGQSIGTVGKSGSVASPQLHFEIRQGSKPVDPAPFIAG